MKSDKASRAIIHNIKHLATNELGRIDRGTISKSYFRIGAERGREMPFGSFNTLLAQEVDVIFWKTMGLASMMRLREGKGGN